MNDEIERLHDHQEFKDAETRARIDELNNLPRAGFIGSNGIRYEATLFTQIDNRIAELQAQLKELS